MLHYRHLFKDIQLTEDTFQTLCERHGGIRSLFIPDYFEDETGKELTSRQMATVLTGNPDSILLPPGAKQYDIDYILSDKRPIPIDQVTLSQEQLNVLGYFARDLRELLTSTLYKDGPGIITGYAGNINVLKTAASDEEIRSFVTIFRRLYMEKEPANFVKVLGLFHNIAHGYPLGQWVQGISNEYQEGLKESPECIPMCGLGKLPFSRKRLIDVFLYTQYAHQPDGRRTQQ
jgi:hypothetical protein